MRSGFAVSCGAVLVALSAASATDFPYAGSEGVGWGLVAVLGGLAFVAVAEWEASRSRPAS